MPNQSHSDFSDENENKWNVTVKKSKKFVKNLRNQIDSTLKNLTSYVDNKKLIPSIKYTENQHAYCMTCGWKIPSDLKICENCGSELK